MIVGSEGEEAEKMEEMDESKESVNPPEPHEEARKPRVARRPQTPTQNDLDEHLPLHLHYRSWCPDCVAGRGTQAPHLTTGDEEDNGATVHMDYAFQSQKDKDEDANPILVAYEEVTKMFWALAVTHKGVQQGPIKFLVDRLGVRIQRRESHLEN